MDSAVPVRGRRAVNGVLLVPNAALRWKPKPAQVAPGLPRRICPGLTAPGRTKLPTAGRSPSDAPNRTVATLWVKTGEFVRPVETKVGLSDGLKTEIAAGGDLIEGSQIVVGQVQAGDGEAATSGASGNPKSPFLPDIKKAKAKK